MAGLSKEGTGARVGSTAGALAGFPVSPRPLSRAPPTPQTAPTCSTASSSALSGSVPSAKYRGVSAGPQRSGGGSRAVVCCWAPQAPLPVHGPAPRTASAPPSRHTGPTAHNTHKQTKERKAAKRTVANVSHVEPHLLDQHRQRVAIDPRDDAAANVGHRGRAARLRGARPRKCGGQGEHRGAQQAACTSLPRSPTTAAQRTSSRSVHTRPPGRLRPSTITTL